MRITKLFKDFFESEKAGGLLLFGSTVLSLILANSIFGKEYQHFWHDTEIGSLSLELWINDGLMAVFFLLIGLELEREIYQGELSNIKEALLPIFAAFGGMLFPAAIYLMFNWGTKYQSGAGIPMATDIAFAIGILSLLGSRVPASLKVFLTALAVIDDLGAILVIAIFYTKSLVWQNLIWALGVFLILLIMNRLKVRNLIPYLFGGVIMWYFMLSSGVHATITGVLLAFAIPFGNGNEKSTSYILQKFLHKPAAFFILPVFALANTAISFRGGSLSNFMETHTIGIALGLILGKPIGIFAMCFLAVFLGLVRLPKELNWGNITGVGFLGGIGFTMSIFISLLAFENPMWIDSSKVTILFSSSMVAIIGYVYLRFTLKKG